MATVKPIPEGENGVRVYLAVANATEALDFYKKVFDARETMRIPAPGGKIGHAELSIGGIGLMLADEHPEIGFKGPLAYGGSPVMLSLYVENVDAWADRALRAGMKTVRPIADQFYGDRGGQFTDPFGHQWWIASRKENVSVDEMKRRAAEKFGK
jgi:PhnB protein